MITRRRLLTGIIAAPIVVRAGLLMPVKAVVKPTQLVIYQTMYEGAVLPLLGRAEMLVEGDAVRWGDYEMRVVRA